MKYLPFLLLFFVILIQSGCDTSTDSQSTNCAQNVFVYAQYYNDYWDRDCDCTVSKENITGFGVLHASPLPRFDYFILADSVYNSSDLIKYFPGYIRFRTPVGKSGRIFHIPDPLKTEVKTSSGKLSGSLSLPDTVTSFTANVLDTLLPGDDFTLSWQGDADFYYVSIGYAFYDSLQDRYGWASIDSFVNNLSVTFPGYLFTMNGYLDFITIRAINGPFPKPGAIGNMTGTGSGYFYYLQDMQELNVHQINVGDGIPPNYFTLSKRSAFDRTDRKTATIKRKIEYLILNE